MSTFKEAFDLLIVIQGAKAKNTLDQTKSIVKHLRWFESACPALAAFETQFEEIWAKYRAMNREKSEAAGRAPRRLSHDRRYLVQALRRAKNKGWIARMFSKADFSLLESSDTVGRHLSQDEMDLILNYLRNRDAKTYLQVLMAYEMGMRISEILGLKKAEVDLENLELNLDPKRLKTRRARKVPIPITTRVLTLLKPRFEKVQGLYIFPATVHHREDPSKPQVDNSYYWDEVRDQTGIDCRFHDLRHTCLTNALARGMAPLTACKIFGCTMQVLERVYDHIRKSDRALHRAILEGKTNEIHPEGPHSSSR